MELYLSDKKVKHDSWLFACIIYVTKAWKIRFHDVKQVRSNNDASELAILGQFGKYFDTFGALDGVLWTFLIIS